MFRDEDAPACPRCDRALELRDRRLKCPSCNGVLVTDAVLTDAIVEICGVHSVPPAVTYVPRTDAAAITCPQCATTMATVSLFTIPVDRCETHGTWFDGPELAAALERANLDAKPVRGKLDGGREAAMVGGLLVGEFLLMFLPWLLF